MSTIRDIAEASGVSTTTVSRYLNGQIRVKEETRKRIDEAVRTLGYRPDFLARSLVLKETKTIGVVIPDILNPFFAGFARGVEDVAWEKGLSVILCNSDNRKDKEQSYLQWLEYKHVDGIVLVSTGLNSEHLQDILVRGIKMVVAGRRIKGLEADRLVIDNVEGARKLTRHLLVLGHTRIAVIKAAGHVSSTSERIKGYEQALSEFKIKPDKELIVTVKEFRYENGYTGMMKLIHNRLAETIRRFTAVFALNDLMAIGAINAIQEYGLSVPGDIAVVGFDGLRLGTWIRPKLTTYGVSPYNYGKRSCRMLLRRISAQDRRRSYNEETIKGMLIVRESCGAVGEPADSR
jgi:LacI family transcriptional regulator